MKEKSKKGNWKCPKCNELNELQFDNCWKCQFDKTECEESIEYIELDESRIKQFCKDFEIKSTEELIDIWQEKGSSDCKWPEEAYEAIEKLAPERNEKLQVLIKGQANDEKKSKGGWISTLGGIIGAIVYFVYFKEQPDGLFSGFGMPTLFFSIGYALFWILGKIISSSKKE